MASSTDYVIGSIGFFVIVGTLLGLSGIQGASISLPKAPEEVNEDNPQGFLAQLGECIITLYKDCASDTETRFFAGFATALQFGVAFVFFFFQLLTFTLPIPAWLNAFIVIPPAIALAYVGIRTIRGAA